MSVTELEAHSDRGTYVLLLRLLQPRNIKIGKLGSFKFRSGYYTYVGSAFGPGGLAGRLKRHIKHDTRPHWHIDYLWKSASPVQVWLSKEQIRREHHWARVLKNLPGAIIPVKGFGSSDCKCESHLFYFKKPPSMRLFQEHLRNHYPSEAPLQCLKIER